MFSWNVKSHSSRFCNKMWCLNACSHISTRPSTIDMMCLEKQTGISHIILSFYKPSVEILCAWLGCGMCGAACISYHTVCWWLWGFGRRSAVETIEALLFQMTDFNNCCFSNLLERQWTKKSSTFFCEVTHTFPAPITEQDIDLKKRKEKKAILWFALQ